MNFFTNNKTNKIEDIKTENLISITENSLSEGSYDYSNPLQTIEEKIKHEKRRRNQAYIMLDYFLSATTYVDFFAFDAFRMTIDAKHYAQVCKKKKVTSEFLFYAFFSLDPTFSELLERYKVSKKRTGQIITASTSSQTHRPSFFQRQLYRLKAFIHDFRPSAFSEEFSVDSSITFSRQTQLLFERAAENAMTRFKTPLISSEILFITLMEEKGTRMAKVIKELIPDKNDWLLLRYQLIKRLHRKETSIRNDVKKSQKYFGYLLHTQITDAQFTALMDNETLASRVTIFRNKLIKEIVKQDYFDALDKEVYNSIKISKQRSYSKYFPRMIKKTKNKKEFIEKK
jgi:hypothetical protein